MSPTERPTDAASVRLDRLERLQGLTAALSAAATPDEVAGLIFVRGLALVGARAVTLFWEAGEGELVLLSGLGLSDEFAQRYRRVTPDAALPSAEAYRTGAAVWLGTRDEIASRFPEAAALVAPEGDEAWAAIPLVVGRSRGALELRFDAPRPFDEAEREFVVAVARQCAQALERARLYEAQKRLADRLQALQQTTAGLAGALTPAEVAAVVFRGLLGLGAQGGGIFYRSAPERLELLFQHGADAAPLLQRLARVPLDAPAPHTDAVRTGAPVWLDTPEAIDAAYPDLAADRAARDEGGWVAVPLALEGRNVGALALTFREGRRLGEEDRGFVLALAQQGAQALERARLFEGQKKLLERLGQIQSTSAALSGAATPRNVAEVAFRGLATLGAVSAEIHALEGLERLALLARQGPVPAVAARPVAIDAPAPAAEVVRTGKALWLESPEEIVDRFPALEAEREARGESSWAVVPLLAGGTTLGALSVAFPAPRRFEPDEKAFVRMLAMPCAQALDRARLYEAAAQQRAETEWNAATLAAMIGAAPVGLALLDRDFRFLRINEVLARIDGVPADAHLGRTPPEVLPGLTLPPVEEAFRRVLETGQRVDDLKVVGETPAAPGTTRRFGVSLYPVRVGAEVVGVGLMVREEKR